MKLTELIYKNAKGAEKPKKLVDGWGLYLEVTTQGGKYWRMKYRHPGKERRLALGVYPEATLKKAREKRDEARKLIAESKDPNYVKRKQKELASDG